MKSTPAVLIDEYQDTADLIEAVSENFYCPGVVRYLDDNFGPGTWVLDPIEDKYVVALGGGDFLVIDRHLRRYPVTIPTCRMH